MAASPAPTWRCILHATACRSRSWSNARRPHPARPCWGWRAGAAGLLVSGAFGRSRYRELVLGGVTRSLVRHAAARRKRAGTSRADAPA